MKLVVTGSTGFIGGEVLAQALTHPDVDAVISLTRREVSDDKLPSQYRAQLRQLVLENNDEWKSYPQYVRDEIRNADGWGEVENAVVRYGQHSPEQLSTCVARPMQVLSRSSPLSSFFQWSGFAIGVDQLAAWLVNAALKGQDTERPIVENKELQNGGSELLRPSSVQKQDSKTPG
ncbi:MAG: hypothetical protein Q9162_007706 [Coniocarpon cinnabarinum]